MTQIATVPVTAAGLVARTRRLAEQPDLLAVGAAADGVLWTSEEIGLAGKGVALRVGIPGGLADAAAVAGVARTLGEIRIDDEVGAAGSGPVAFASLPFSPAAPGTLIVPERIVVRRGDEAWETTVAPGGEHPAGTEGDVGALGSGWYPPDEFTLSPSMPHDAWRKLIARTVEVIGRSDLDKVVLARRVDVVANRPFSTLDILERLRALYPACMLFHVDGFVGASPELLAGRRGRSFASHPLAGTVARSGDRHADDALVAALLESAKERWEHRIVIDRLVDALAPWCAELAVPETPSVVGLRNVSHLATLIHGELAERHGRVPSVLDLVAAIHPTPAVGGAPTAGALEYLAGVEGFERGPYAGPVGWVDASGDGDFALGIRSAVVDGHRASMYAGVGVVAGSDPAAELAETQLKLQALLAALVRP